MKVITGKVVAGKIVVEGEPLEEGHTVTGDSHEWHCREFPVA